MKKKISARTVVQLFFFILVAVITINKGLSEVGLAIPLLASASLHAICPFGGVESLYQFATVGTFIQKIHSSAFVLMILVFILAVLFGPVFCGWVCPFGSFQEWLGKAGRKLFDKKYNRLIPQGVDKWLRYLRYVFLVLVIYNTATTAKLVFQDIDPYWALFNFWTNEVAISAYIILGVVIVLSLAIERPYCKYACPYGALLGLTNLFRVFRIKRSQATCIDCKACDRACPMNITVSDKGIVRDHQCISCLKCTSEYACPVKNTLDFSAIGGKQA